MVFNLGENGALSTAEFVEFFVQRSYNEVWLLHVAREGKIIRDSGWGTHVNPWLIHVNVWQKPLQYCKVISLQLIKINGKKIKIIIIIRQDK